MTLTFIGFSGSGKSFYSKQLEQELSWSRVDCDTLILDALNAEEGIALKTLPEIATWHGAPNDPDFRRRDSLLLVLEYQVMRELIASGNFAKNTVLDTSGSFVLLPEEVISEYKNKSKLVYLRYEEEDIEQMIAQYFKDPKPVIWQHLFKPRYGESFIDTVKRCFVDVVNYRKDLYEKYADFTINISFKKRDQLSIVNTLKQHEIL